ncbi:MAG: FAD-dependent oxidoreductase, partial [Oscillospiraceae bacterium]|nr:FAD-dependent oxidoreductase [Oscillospiraceae bacterium]
MENEKKLEARPPEVKRLRCDVLVLGGGRPGVCAAIAAARGGLDVILAERSLTLGGNCGPEIGVHPSDGHRFHPYMATTGVVGRLIEEAAFRNAKTNSHGRHYNISVQFDRVLQEALDEAGVRVLRSTYAHTPYLDGARIAAVECEDTLTYERVCIEVEQFVIDDTGDGNVSERAGAGYRMGREARAEFGERMAPETADGVTMGSSLVTLLCRTGSETRFVPGKGVPPFHPGYGGEARFRPQDGENVYFWFPTETGGDVDTIRDGHLIYDRLRGHLDSAWDRCKNRLDADVTGEWEMIWVSAKVGKRESRRFIGDYTVTESDVENGTMFEDAIAAGGFAVDVHDPQKDDPAYVSVTYYLIPPTYTIP